jgi:hypothetical protein
MGYSAMIKEALNAREVSAIAVVADELDQLIVG